MVSLFPPSLVEYQVKDTIYRFLICDAPNDSNLRNYIDIWKQHNVSHVVRVCDPTYAKLLVEDEGIQVTDFAFSDGENPSPKIISQWLRLVSTYQSQTTIAIHCVAGLGRAPLLVCIALMELHQLDPLEAIRLVRTKRPGSLNVNQLKYLREYNHVRKNNCCIV